MPSTGSLKPPSRYSFAAEIQMPMPLTALNSSHQASAAGSAFSPLVRSQMAMASARSIMPATLPFSASKWAHSGPIAQVRHFPVEDGDDLALLVVQEIAAAIVAVDDADSLRGFRPIAPQPAD